MILRSILTVSSAGDDEIKLDIAVAHTVDLISSNRSEATCGRSISAGHRALGAESSSPCPQFQRRWRVDQTFCDCEPIRSRRETCYRLVVAYEPGIYVEILICAAVDEIWRRTQVPDLHERWDLRFTTIAYLPRDSEAEPQKFLYSTRIGFDLKISGEGESTGTREDVTGVRTSALSFWSSDPKSLIEEGSGYCNTIQPHLEVDS
jgi:hypothetical protein